MTAAAGGDGLAAAPPSAEARLKALYSVMQSLENRLGGGEGVEGLYGSIKKGGMERVLGCMRDKCGLGASSVLVDIGAGLGRPLMHALLEPGVAGARGIEIDRIKCDKAAAFLRQAVAELQRRGAAGDALVPPPVECCAIENVRSLEPCTHAYSFWEGVPVEGKAAFGRLFAASRSLRAVAVVQRAVRTCPLAYMADLGFGELSLAASFPVSMSGSGRSFTAYVFNRVDQPAALQPPLAAEQAGLQSVQTPGQGGEGARAAVSTGAVAAAAEVEGETAQSRLAAAAVEPVAASGGRRQRRPSAKQQAADEEREAEARQTQQRRARQQRASRRTAAATEAEDAAVADAAASQAAAETAPQAGPRPAPAARTRSVSRPAGPASPPKPAGRLGSPAKGGVRKRGSPQKPANRSPPKAEPTAGARRGLALGGARVKGGPGAAAAHAPGSAGLLQRAARVIKSGVADGVSRLRPARSAATTARRGLKTD